MKFWLQALGALIASIWMHTPLAIQVLLGLMVADIATGLVQAYINRKLDSHVSFVGLLRKVLILIVISVAVLLQRALVAQGYTIPLDAIVGGFYIVHETLSIIENVTLAGLPVPDALRDALVKLGHKPDLAPTTPTHVQPSTPGYRSEQFK